tara:strand:- start:208 stop:1449 length:1242 start_codon:yes stop_codon:yes gene_type:complete
MDIISNSCQTIKSCRISNSKDLVKVLDLGIQPLANSLKKKSNDQEDRYPLTLSFSSESCLLQLNETIKKEKLFDSYVWVTSTSSIAKKYAETFYKNVTQNISLDKNKDLIIEIASNDGTFLKPFIKNGHKKVLGIDPAKNICEIANKSNVKTLNEYWNKELANKLLKQQGSAKLVFARNVIPHVSELDSVVSGIEKILDDNGVGIFEIHDANVIFDQLHYDSVYHEHLCYFTLKSITYLLNKFNLFPFEVNKSPISGGSFVIYFSKKKISKSKNYEIAVIQEEQSKVNELNSWKNFAEKVNNHKNEIKKIFSHFNGKRIIGFGSSARSQTFLNYCNFNEKNIELIIDNNPLKQNFFSPGSNIKIVDFAEGISVEPEVIFILAWNFKSEIIDQCKLAGFKGEYIIPFPNKPEVI